MLYFSAWEINAYENYPTLRQEDRTVPCPQRIKLPSVDEVLRRIRHFQSGEPQMSHISSCLRIPSSSPSSPESVNSILSSADVSSSVTPTYLGHKSVSNTPEPSQRRPPAQHSAISQVPSGLQFKSRSTSPQAPRRTTFSKQSHTPTADEQCLRGGPFSKSSHVNRGRKRRCETVCHQCKATSTPEWRRGPTGSRSLCNACGLYYMKLQRRFTDDQARSVLVYKKHTDTIFERLLPSTSEVERYCALVKKHNWS